ncbi:MAG: D-aminoacyl-tRNA deacylase [Myxococcaceae bacterium]|nr:D-aminoacyl-tRNA deacylase [Myxococcaceae bacterium]MCI0671142.1 D-aminoacyl-tRNA deacylase [Myxococcaceae bacterium]
MRAVVQRVSEASVTVGGERVAQMGPGLLVLLGVGKGDTEADVAWMADKVPNLRIFEDAEGKMNRSLLDTHRALIVVSQFTLYGDARKGRRPSFIEAAEPAEAQRLYEEACRRMREAGLSVGMGVFRAEMRVALVNEGPVTILLDSRS